MLRTALAALVASICSPALAEQVVIYPGDSLPISPYDQVYCAHAPGVAYDYCACGKGDSDGWAVYRYRKVYDGGETLMIDPMSKAFPTLVDCNQFMGTLALCLPRS